MNGNDDLEKVIKILEKSEGIQVEQISTLAGGSINNVYLLHSDSLKGVLKINEAAKYSRMFKAERAGLETLRKSQTFRIPKTLADGEVGKLSFLFMEFISEGQMPQNFWDTFSSELAELHKLTSETFGWAHQNYIGSLPQFNTPKATAADFYVTQRLLPQIQMARDKGYNLRLVDQALKNIAEAIPPEPPSLIHGDLWSGNYLVDAEGKPCLIDPAVCFAPREMDLAMMRLFGGFPDKLFSQYSEIYPLLPEFSQRIRLWQLYYLLVHLNIFGRGYYSSVEEIFIAYS